MTDTLKTALVDALDAEREDHPLHGDIIHLDDWRSLDRLATAVLAFVLDREKVKAALIAALVSENDFIATYAKTGCVALNVDLKADKLVDRLISGLAGGTST